MENYKLNILQRNHDKTGWHNSEQLSDSDITNIKVLDSRNDKSLNAIPSPFARVHLFDAAFSLVYQDELYGTNNSGEAYKKLVSDCFDVFELIFNWNSHVNEGKKLEIITWNRETETSVLQREFQEKKVIKEQEIRRSNQENKIFLLQEVDGYKENLVAETLSLFLNDGIFKPFETIHIIKLDGEPIAGTSPLTGFFTTPNDLSKFKIINPLTKRAYFSKTRLFAERDIKIKKFIYDFIITEGESVFKDNLPISKYLDNHSRDISNINLNLCDLASPNNSILNNSIKLKSSKERPAFDYFEQCLVRLNYRINDECFYYASNPKTERSYDYLLPLTKAFFEDFEASKIPSIVTVNEKDSETVEIVIRKENQKFSKTYQKNKISEIDGKIIELSEIESIKVNLGIFPFIKVTDSNSEELTEFNDFYRLMFVCQDNNYRFDNDDFSVEFGKDKMLINPNEATNYSILKENRTILQKDKTLIGSTYYSTNFCFDYIKINLPNVYDTPVSGIIAPKWKEKKLGDKTIDYAIDFGTTTTFVAYTDDQNHQSSPKKFDLPEKELPVALLNKPKDKKPQFRWIDCYEHHSVLPDFSEFFEVQKQEFLPSIFNSEKYEFPFRTVIYEKDSIAANQKKCLINSNIAFTYQKEDNNVTHLHQKYLPNLKWNVKTDSKYQESVEVFIEELFQLLRLKTILNDGDPKKSRVSWFSPLSFTPGAQFTYNAIWGEKYKSIFKGNKDLNLRNITESEAPFYYYSKIQEDASGAQKIEDTSSVLTLDIGGGTTDLMYFRTVNSVVKPILGSSFHFGANILWGEGYSEFIDAKSNGIFLKLKDKISEKLKSTELKKLNEEFISNFGSDEILNFWIQNNDKTNIQNELNNGEFKLAYVLHLSSLIYHSFKLLAHNSHPVPKCIIFTGNGSKYLDLIQTKDYIEKICKYFANKVFGSDFKPQVILPSTNRKEATCFGGLYQPFQNKRDFEAINYLGFENKGESFKKYNEIDARKDSVFDQLSNSFNEFIEIFFSMNDNPELSFRRHFGIESNLSAVKNYMISKCKVNLTTGYDKRRKIVDSGDEITDSLFFYPIVGLIYQINKLSKQDINEFIPKTVYYTLSPDDDNSFDEQRISSEKKPDSIFYITIENMNPDFGELSIISDGNAIKRAMAGVNSFLKSVCDFDEFPDNPNQSIEIVTNGKVLKEGSKWYIKERIKIKFV